MLQKFVFCIVFCAFVHSASAQNLGFSLTDGQTKVRIPIEICNNLIVVPVVINGRLPLKFILDTGVRTTILTEKTFGDFLHLSYARKYTISGPGGTKLIDCFVTNNVSIDMPGVHGRGHAMLVLDQDYLELRNYLGTDVHGILGYELFSRFIVQIDYENKLLTLMLPERFKPGKRFQCMNISVQDTKPYMMADIQMNDTTKIHAKLLVDTGASHGLLLDVDSDPKLQVPAKHINSTIGRGLGGAIFGQIARIKSLQLANYKLDKVIVNFPAKDSYSDALKRDDLADRNGSIGGEIMSRFTVVFDFPKEKLYLRKNSSFRKEFHYNLSGLTLKAYGERLRSFEISDVRENSTADRADIKVGDRIVSFNGQDSAELTLDKTDDILNSRPGRRVVLEILRNGKKMKREFLLESPI